MSENRNKDLKTRERFSTSVNKELLRAFEGLHDKTRIPKSKLIDEAMELLLEKHEYKKNPME